MKLNKNINYNRIEIWAPRYHDALRKGSYAVMVAPWKVGEHNIIYLQRPGTLKAKNTTWPAHSYVATPRIATARQICMLYH